MMTLELTGTVSGEWTYEYGLLPDFLCFTLISLKRLGFRDWGFRVLAFLYILELRPCYGLSIARLVRQESQVLFWFACCWGQRN